MKFECTALSSHNSVIIGDQLVHSSSCLQNQNHKFHLALEHVYIKIHIHLKCYFSIPCSLANKLFPLIYPKYRPSEYFIPRYRADEIGTLV